MVARGGIEPPTRGFSIRKVKHLVFINQLVTGASDAHICSTVHNDAGLIHAKLTHCVKRCDLQWATSRKTLTLLAVTLNDRACWNVIPATIISRLRQWMPQMKICRITHWEVQSAVTG